MKYFSRVFQAAIALCLLLLPVNDLLAQKSSAELINTIQPPKLDNNIQVNDGERQVNIFDDHLLISNYWAGLRIFDVSDVSNPVEKAFMQLEEEAYNAYADQDYIYFASHKAGVQIYDINTFGKIAQIKTPGRAFWVEADYPYLFVAMGDEGFCIMNIAEMSNPTTVFFEVPAEWVRQVTADNGRLYLAAKKGGVIIYDISQPEDPQKLSQFRTNYDVTKIQLVDNLAYVADGPGGLLVLDLTNPRSPKPVSRYTTRGFIGDVHKVGNYAYLANQNMGLQIVNVTDPANPFLEGEYQTESACYGVFKKDIYVFLASNTATLIMRHNNNPQLADIPDLTLKEGEPFELTLNVTEPDGDPFVLEAFNIPEGSSFDAETGLFHWMPDYEQSGVYGSVIFQVTEQTPSRLSAADTITITVEHVNRLPDLPSIENKTIDENNTLAFEVPEGSDPDAEDQHRLRYYAENLPEGAEFDTTTRAFSWTPTYEQSGIYVIDFLLDDGAGGIDREPVTVTVNHVDRKPEIDAITDKEIDENQTLTIAVSGFDPDEEDQDKISFVMENLPSGAEFDPAGQTLTWTPTYDQSGVYSDIRAIMIAGNMSDTTTFNITVNHVNRPPVMAEIGDRTINENEELAFTLDVSDPDVEDEGKLRVATETLPAGAEFDTSIYRFSWTPTYEQSGAYSGIGFIVADPDGLSDRKETSITVNHVNRPPTIENAPDLFVNESEPVEIQLVANDPDREDQDRLVFSAEPLPEGARLDFEGGLFQWTPTYEQSGVYDIFFLVSDGEFKDSTFTRITVENVNRPPQLEAIADQSVDENESLSFTISGSDPDSEDEGNLTYAAQNLPPGAVFDDQNLTFRWTPTYEQSGAYPITFLVTDLAGLTDQQTVTITVNHVNRPPTLEAVADQTIDENEPLTLQLTGADPDSEDTGKLVYQITNLPRGANLNQNSGLLTWTPTFDQAGNYPLTAVVADASGLQAEQSFTITVNNVNRPPVLEEIPPQTGKENSSLTFTLRAQDPDREDVGKLTYSAANLPDGARLSSSTGEFFWTPTYEQSGEYQIDFQVTDSFGAADNTSVSITIENVNRPPFIEGLSKRTVKENEPIEFTLTSQDPDPEDAGKVRLRAVKLPRGASFDANSGRFTWTPDFDQSGDYVVEFEVSDPQGASVNETMLITVENANRQPSIESPGDRTINAGETLTFQITAGDPDKEDAGNLEFSAENMPSGAQLSPDGRFSWTPRIDQPGSYEIGFTVKDREGSTDSVTITVQVEGGAGGAEGQ